MTIVLREQLISDLLCTQIIQLSGSVGILIQDVPYLDTAVVLKGLAKTIEHTDLRIAYLKSDVDTLAPAAGIPADKFTSSIQQAEQWRNDRNLDATIVVIATDDQARLSSMQDFAPVGPTQLKRLLVHLAQTGPAATNEVLINWWKKLGTDRNISLGQLVDYYASLPTEPDRETEFKTLSSRELPRLGLLADPKLFDDPKDRAVGDRIRRNRDLVSRLQTLTEKDRRTIAETIAKETDPDRQVALRQGLRLLRLLRRGEPTGQLTVTDAEDLFSVRRPQPNLLTTSEVPEPRDVSLRPITPTPQPLPFKGDYDDDKCAESPDSLIPVSATTAEALLSDDKSRQDDLNIAAETVARIGETDGGGSKVGIERWDTDLPSGVIVGGQLSREVRDIVTRLVAVGRYGGWIASNEGDIWERIRGYRGEEDLKAEWTSSQIIEFLDSLDSDSGRELNTRFTEFDQARNRIVEQTASLAAEPLLVAATPGSRDLVRNYVERYHDLLKCISRTHGELFAEYTQDVNQVVSHILMLDTITFGSGMATIAMLTPLHPLYLWRYSEFARIVAAQRHRLSPRDVKLVVSSAQQLPNFLTSLCLPDLTPDTPQVLPQVSAVDNLPYFAVRQERSVGHDGFKAVARIVEAFLEAHPPTRYGLRLALLDPPGHGPYLKLLTDLAYSGKIEGGHLTVLYKGRSTGIQSLGLDDDSEARVAQLFRATAEDRRFSFEVRSLPADISNLPGDLLAHITVAFDQSGGRQDALSVVEQPIQPLAMPQRLKYRVFAKTVDLEPAPGGPFAAYFNVAQLVAKQAPASRLSVRQDGDVRERLKAAAATAPWFVLADRHVDRDLLLGSLQVFSGRDETREVVAFADATGPFRHALRDVVRQYNTAVSDADLDDLLRELTDLLDVGALTLTPDLERQADQSRTKGLLGTLIAARWYKTSCPVNHKRLLISLDDDMARRWLHLREDARRADLLGIEYSEDRCVITVFEVKTMQDTSAEFRIDGDTASGPAVDQTLSTGMLLRDVFNPDRADELITTPARREVLRAHVYRELAKRGHDADDRKTWAGAAQRLFEGNLPFTIELHLVEVSIGVDSESLRPPRMVSAQASDGQVFPLTVTQLNESGVEALQQNIPASDKPLSFAVNREEVAEQKCDATYPPSAAASASEPMHPSAANTIATTAIPDNPPPTPADRPRAYLGQASGQYGKPVEIWYDPQRPDRPLANGHIAITGETGSGKTQATKSILHELMAPPGGMPALILDFKDDYAGTEYVRREQLSMFDASIGGLPFNPLVPPIDPTSGRANPMSHVHQLVGIIKRIYRLGDQQAYNLREAMKETYAISGVDGKPFTPASDQTYLPFDAIREVLERDSHGPLIGRLSPIFDLDLFAYEGDNGATIEELLDGRSVVRLSQLPGEEVKNAVAEFLLMALYNHLIRRPQPRVLKRLVVLDEAWRLVQSPFLEPLMREGRAFGAGVVIATQYPKDLPDSVSGATATRLFFSQTQADQIRTVQKALVGKTSGADAEQVAALVRSMPPLTCMVQNAHQTPYVRTAIRPYYERATETDPSHHGRLF
ncbi:ATP-binding protein [Saccharothrix australiensis]|uniref:AAA domain-containing protein n=1 Tax=Saccharothrix australiensis TaxID=2072 RepID=A0A495VW84_9PSEU|nr:ATP-binding protein [Saccharothrix australiensis]RKT52803.1 AAA domain-containing protein [Saccharothrix australiensis]